MVRQVRIRCLCRSLRLQDLGIDLIQGQEMFLTEEQAQRSRDLLQAVRNKAVEVNYETLCERQRKPEDPTLHRGGFPVVPPPGGSNAIPPVRPETVIDVDVIAQKVSDKVLRKLLAAVPGLMAQMQVDSITQRSQDTPGEKPESTAPIGNESVFIPDKLVTEKTGKVGVESGESETDDVAAAAKLLRKKRRKRND